jgi:hypothetical protein
VDPEQHVPAARACLTGERLRATRGYRNRCSARIARAYWRSEARANRVRTAPGHVAASR